MMTPTTLMNIIRATGSTRVANDLADLRLAQYLPTATPDHATQQGGHQTVPQAATASHAPKTAQDAIPNATATPRETPRPVGDTAAQRLVQAGPAPSTSHATPQAQHANMDNVGFKPSVTLTRSFFQSLPAPITQGAVPSLAAPLPMEQGRTGTGVARPNVVQGSDVSQATTVHISRSRQSASAGATRTAFQHPAAAQLESVLDRLATQFLPRGPVPSPSRGMAQPDLQSAPRELSVMAKVQRPVPVQSLRPLPRVAPAQAGGSHLLSPQQPWQSSQLTPLLRDAAWRVISHPNPASKPVEPVRLGGDMTQPVPSVAHPTQLRPGDSINTAIPAAVLDENTVVQSAPVAATQPVTPITARDLSILVAMNAAMIPGFPNLMSLQTAAALRSRDLGQKLADLAHKLRTMDPQEQRIFLAGLHLPIRVLHEMQRQAKKWARQLGDTITPETIEGFLLLCLTVLGWPTMVAEYLWYCMTATDDPDDIPPYETGNV